MNIKETLNKSISLREHGMSAYYNSSNSLPRRMLYLWSVPENFLDRDTGEYNSDCSPDRFLLKSGRLLDVNEFTPTPRVDFEITKKRALQFDCLPNTSLIPLVNIKIKNILEELAKNDVQFLPAILKCSDGEIHDYYFLNIPHKIIGIDHEKSSYTKMPFGNAISMIKFLTYKKDCMGKHQLARDEEFLGNLLVNEKIKMVFDKENITGVRFTSPEEYWSNIY